MDVKNSLLPLCGLALLLGACSTADFNRIPHTGFINHYNQADQNVVPFSSYWVAPGYGWSQWDKMVAGTYKLHVKPVTLAYYNGKPADAEDATAIESLRSYFDERLKAEFAKKSTLQLSDSPKGAWTLEIALLEARSAKTGKNLATGVLGEALGGGFIWKRLISSKDERTGHLAMAGRIYDANGKLVAEVADFAYGMSSLVGTALIDTKDFRRYAYQRKTVEQWAEDFADLAVSPMEKKVGRTSISISPF